MSDPYRTPGKPAPESQPGNAAALRALRKAWNGAAAFGRLRRYFSRAGVAARVTPR